MIAILLKRSLTPLLIIAILAPSLAAFALPKKAEAQGIIACGGLIAAAQGIGSAAAGLAYDISRVWTVDGPSAQRSQAITSTESTTENVFECILKTLVILLAKTMIRQITQSLITWINSGFQGNPAFITDLNGFLLGIVDQVIGEFIYGSELAFLCSPFQLQIRIAIALQYQSYSSRARCTLTQITQNVNNFLTRLANNPASLFSFSTNSYASQGFFQGGWPYWFSMVTNDQNNPYGAYQTASAELSIRLAGAQARELKLLDFGRGFLSWRECSDAPPSTGPTPSGNGYIRDGASQFCSIRTPGTVIESQLEHVLGSDVRQLELANSVDAIILALLGQLIRQVFSGVGGLLGTTQASPSFNGLSSVDSLLNQSNTNALEQRRTNGQFFINSALDIENRYLDVLEQELAAVSSAGALVQQLNQCYLNHASSLTGADQATAQQRATTASSTYNTTIAPRLAQIQARIAQTENNIDELNRILVLTNAAATQTQMDEASRQFGDLQLSGTLHSDPDVTLAGYERDLLVQEMSGVSQATQSQIAECNTFPPPPAPTADPNAPGNIPPPNTAL